MIVLSGYDHRLSGGATARQAHLELVHDDGRQGLELAGSPGVDRDGFAIDHAERAKIVALAGAQRHRNAKTAVGFSADAT